MFFIHTKQMNCSFFSIIIIGIRKQESNAVCGNTKLHKNTFCDRCLLYTTRQQLVDNELQPIRKQRKVNAITQSIQKRRSRRPPCRSVGDINCSQQYLALSERTLHKAHLNIFLTMNYPKRNPHMIAKGKSKSCSCPADTDNFAEARETQCGDVVMRFNF